jgi:hypothetical protein
MRYARFNEKIAFIKVCSLKSDGVTEFVARLLPVPSVRGSNLDIAEAFGLKHKL